MFRRHKSKTRTDYSSGWHGTVDETADPNTFVMLALEEENKAAVATLNLFGLDGSVCGRKAPRLKKINIPITIAGSHAWKTNLIVISAHTAGQQFLLTKEGAVNSDDTFIGFQRRRNEEQFVVLTKKKSIRWLHSNYNPSKNIFNRT